MIWTYLLVLVPISLALQYLLHAPPVWVFAAAILAIIPLAEWVRRATEQASAITGSAIGGLLNVTFGNAPELILAIVVLASGSQEVVKAQITGAIIGNGLLGLGLAVLVGSWGRKQLFFSKERAGLLSSLLFLSLIALLLPALFDITERTLLGNANPAAPEESLSLGVAVVLIVVYIANLLYTLMTHEDIFAMPEEDPAPAEQEPLWKVLAILLGATVLVALEAELVADSLSATAKSLGLTEFFLGVIVLAIIGNIAEYVSSAYFARQDRMSLALGITVGSTVQVALLVAPLVVVISYLTGNPMNLVFSSPLELIAMAGVAFVVNAIAHDGETNWFEGLLLVAVYVLMGLAFFFVKP